MLSFYLIAGGLAAAVAAVLVRPLIAGRTGADSRDARDAAVFRDQLAEIDRDLARGTITPGEAEGARAEVSRRLLAADQRARHGGALAPAPQGHSGLIAGLALVGTPALAVALYLGVGAPGVPDQPLAARPEAVAALGGAALRPGQAEAEAAMAGQERPQETPDPQYAAMVTQLEIVLENRPDDVQGHRMLANALMNLGRYAEAWRAYARVLELTSDAADAEAHAAMAEGMILAAGGYVSPEAERAVARALELAPDLPVARYYGGLALRQAGRTDEAIAMWEGLRRDSPGDAPYLPWLDTMLADARQSQGGGAGGPTLEDIAAAERLSAEERAAMIDDMVARLDARLAASGGSAEEWGRLIASYATLGQTEAAADAYARALAALDDAGDAAVRAQAARLGLAGVAPVDDASAAPAASAPPAAPGPTPEDVAAAERLSADERMAMVEGMVARLDARLAESGGSAEEWGRLIASYATLGQTEAAADAYARALAALDDAGDAAVRAQAARLGLAGVAPVDDASAAPAASAPPAAPGPTPEDVAAAERLSADERMAMVEGMVARLDARLAESGGSAEEWSRLMASYATLGRAEAAADAFARALAALDGAGAEAVRAQAVRLGLADPAAPGSPAAVGGTSEAPPADPAPAGSDGAGPGAPAAAAPAEPGPTQADIAAAASMAPGDRAAMIEGMVARLESRLTGEGGGAEEWLRLINAYVQLDRADEAARAYRLAAAALAGDPQAGFVKEQALLMGVAVE